MWRTSGTWEDKERGSTRNEGGTGNEEEQGTWNEERCRRARGAVRAPSSLVVPSRSYSLVSRTPLSHVVPCPTSFLVPRTSSFHVLPGTGSTPHRLTAPLPCSSFAIGKSHVPRPSLRSSPEATTLRRIPRTPNTTAKGRNRALGTEQLPRPTSHVEPNKGRGRAHRAQNGSLVPRRTAKEARTSA